MLFFLSLLLVAYTEFLSVLLMSFVQVKYFCLKFLQNMEEILIVSKEESFKNQNFLINCSYCIFFGLREVAQKGKEVKLLSGLWAEEYCLIQRYLPVSQFRPIPLFML